MGRRSGKRTRLEIWTPYAASMARDAAHTRAAEDDSPDPVPGAEFKSAEQCVTRQGPQAGQDICTCPGQHIQKQLTRGRGQHQ